jgi:hypothetical protein
MASSPGLLRAQSPKLGAPKERFTIRDAVGLLQKISREERKTSRCQTGWRAHAKATQKGTGGDRPVPQPSSFPDGREDAKCGRESA